MFGGVCFLRRGNMLCGTGKADFMFRVGKDQDAGALSRKGARPMDITGRGTLTWSGAQRTMSTP